MGIFDELFEQFEDWDEDNWDEDDWKYKPETCDDCGSIIDEHDHCPLCDY